MSFHKTFHAVFPDFSMDSDQAAGVAFEVVARFATGRYTVV